MASYMVEASSADEGVDDKKYRSTAGKHGFIVVPEDLRESEINRCIFGLETNEKPTFDYFDYMEFNRLRVLLHKVGRINDAVRNPQSQSQVKVPSNKDLKRLIMSKYGPLDFGSRKMEKLLNVMKESVMALDEVDPNDPAIMDQLYDEYIDPCDLFLAEEQLQALILQRFDGKLQLYQNFDPREADGEWFVLPRGDPSVVRDMNFEQVPHPSKRYIIEREVKKGGRIVREVEYHAPEAPEDVKQPLSNLHLYDPKFELCFKWPYRIFRSECENQEDHEGIPKMVSLRILEHLNNYPFGVTPTMFWETFYEAHKKRFHVEKMTPVQVLRHHPLEIWFVKNVVPGLPELIFPRFLENVICLDTVLKRVWHSIKCIVGMTCYALDEDLLWRIELLYNLKFDPKAWGFENMQSFVTFCNKKFGESDLAVHRVLSKDGNEDVYLDYVVIDSREWRYHVEQLHGVDGSDSTMGLQSIPFPVNYLEFDNENVISSCSSRLSKLQGFECVLEYMTSPLNMFVIDEMYVKERDDFMVKLQSHNLFRLPLKQSTAHALANTVQRGVYMLANLSYKGQVARWYRVRIVNKVYNSETHYNVFGIDYGFIQDVPLTHLRYLPRGALSEQQAYAIPVQLHFKPPALELVKQKLIYAVTGRKLCNSLDGNRFFIILDNARFDRTFGCLKWTVTCHWVEPRNNASDPSFVLYPHVALMIAHTYFKQELEEKIKEEANLEETVPNEPTKGGDAETTGGIVAENM